MTARELVLRNSINGLAPFKSPSCKVMYSFDAIFGSSLPGWKLGTAGAVGSAVESLALGVEFGEAVSVDLGPAVKDFVSVSFTG